MSDPQLTESQETALNSFLGITGCDDVNKAINHLRVCEWNVDNAINRFFEPTSTPTLDDNNSNEGGNIGNRVNPQSSSSRIAGFPSFSGSASFISWITRVFWYILENSFQILFLPVRLLLGPTRSEASASKLHESLKLQFGDDNLPPFQENPSEPLASFLSRAKESLQYVVVYIHQPSHGFSQKFLSQYLCHEKFVAFFRETDNNVKLWVASYSDSLGKKAAQDLQVLKFPFLAIVSPVLDLKQSLVEEGESIIPLNDLIPKWANYMASQASSISRTRRDRQERESARILRQEQNAAYEASLLADREKARILALEKQKQEMAVAAARNRREEKQRKREKRKSYRETIVLPPEPDSSAKNVCRISIRYPNGNRQIRKFYPENPVKVLYDFCEKTGDLDLDYKYVICSHFPRIEYDLESKGNQKLQDVGLVPSANLFVEEVESTSSSSSSSENENENE